MWLAPARASAAPAFESLLSPAEAARASAFQHQTARAEFVVGRGLVRTLVGQAIGMAPDRVPVRLLCAGCGSTEHGKPVLEVGHVSIAHSHGFVLVALAVGGPVGVDVERARAPEDGLAEQILTPAERVAFNGARAGWLLERWCEKEAVTKRSGLGLAADFRTVTAEDVVLLPSATLPPEWVAAVAFPPGTRTVRWVRVS